MIASAVDCGADKQVELDMAGRSSDCGRQRTKSGIAPCDLARISYKLN